MPRITAGEETFSSYASGNGAIQFCKVLPNGNAAGEVPLHIAEILKPKGWKLTDHNGSLEAYSPVNRANDVLEMEGRLFRYGVELEGSGCQRYWFKDAEEGHPIKNLSIIGSLSYLLNNEERLKP